jgi:hypothetical protein
MHLALFIYFLVFWLGVARIVLATIAGPWQNPVNSAVLSARQSKPNTLNQIASWTADVFFWEERDANNLNNQFYQVATLIIVDEYVAFEMIIKASSGVGIRDKTVDYQGLEKRRPYTRKSPKQHCESVTY